MLVHTVILLSVWLGEQGAGVGVAAQIFDDNEDNINLKQGCVMPEPPENGNYTLLPPQGCLGPNSTWGECKNAPGDKVPHYQMLRVSCKPGHPLRGHSSHTLDILCINGHWNNNFTVCENYSVCHRLVSDTVDVKCMHDGKKISCENQMPAGTTATSKCVKHFRKPQHSEEKVLQCLDNGQWSHLLEKCDPPDCGYKRPTPPGLAFLDPQWSYPWSAFIFIEHPNLTWSMAGQGTLITPKVVLTGPINLGGNKQRLRVKLGPYNKHNYKLYIEVPEDVPFPSYPENSSDKTMQLILLSSWGSDTIQLMPVCVDWDNSHTVPSGTNGHVVSWGKTDEHHNYNLKYLDNSSCRKSLKKGNLANDEVCVWEDKNNLTKLGALKLSNGEIGSSLTVVEDDLHFLVGVLNKHVPLEDGSTYAFKSVKFAETISWIKKSVALLESYKICRTINEQQELPKAPFLIRICQTNEPGPAQTGAMQSFGGAFDQTKGPGISQENAMQSFGISLSQTNQSGLAQINTMQSFDTGLGQTNKPGPAQTNSMQSFSIDLAQTNDSGPPQTNTMQSFGIGFQGGGPADQGNNQTMNTSPQANPPISFQGGGPADQGNNPTMNTSPQANPPISFQGGGPADQGNNQTMNTSPQANPPISFQGGGPFDQGNLIVMDNRSIFERENEWIYLPSPGTFPPRENEWIYLPSPGTFPPRQMCIVPNEKENMVFTRYNCETSRQPCERWSGDMVPHSEVLEVSCLPGNYLPHGETTIVSCQDGVWVPDFQDCHKRCPPLTSQTLELKCRNGYIESKCNEPMLPDTIVECKCRQYFIGADKFPKEVIKCNADGSWSRVLPHCKPRCGVSNVNMSEIQPAILAGNISRPGDFPWQTNLYYRENSTWVSKCGGTLISHRHVLTAAHCVTSPRENGKSPPMEPADLMVAFGKSYRDWEKGESTEIKKQIHKILVHPSYFGSSLNYDNDIAILLLESEVNLSNFMMPACVDFNQEHEKELKRDKTKQGYVSGWGNTEECSIRGGVCHTPSDKLKYAQTPIVFIEECHEITQKIKRLPLSRLTVDKFCSDNGSESVLEPGDSGGGLTLKFGGLHYVYGVVSFKLKMDTDDKVYYNFGMFTNVSFHKEWINTQISY